MDKEDTEIILFFINHFIDTNFVFPTKMNLRKQNRSNT